MRDVNNYQHEQNVFFYKIIIFSMQLSAAVNRLTRFDCRWDIGWVPYKGHSTDLEVAFIKYFDNWS